LIFFTSTMCADSIASHSWTLFFFTQNSKKIQLTTSQNFGGHHDSEKEQISSLI